ncbi:FHA domain-containing protein [Salmonirosea aquatica]|uniref:FHA domain-containing protein n=1 Tax=Salmonirosea aquatica TaxID=2654236 RepID=A0A7C9BUA8_9BACT|nr:FHA domain-containing protein [Cytophagaceae bacterium SJW1-29]
MEITCRKCSTRLLVTNTATPIIKCTTCGYPNPVIAGGTPSGTAQATPVVAPASSSPTATVPPRTPAAIPSAPRPVPPPRTAPPPAAAAPEMGWLVVHDENAPPQTHPLRIGRQIVGRKSVSRPCDIMIETDDPYMGRNHCIVEVKPSRSGGYDFFLSDVTMTSGTPEQMSTNGTFVNAYPTALRPKDMVYLNDGDTIQMGKTKVVIKTLITATNGQDASRIVQETDYSPTVIIK